MIKKYRKGYVAELSLTHTLAGLGYMAVRTPRSGRINLASPDVIAAKDGKLIVIECKAHASGFKIPEDQLKELSQWETVAGAKAYVAWKVSRKGWYFLKLNDVLENGGNVGKKLLEQKALSISEI